MADKTPKDYREVTTPKADSDFSEPNLLNDALDDLEAYEDWSNTDNLFQSIDGDRLKVEKHVPYDDAEKAEKVKKKALKSDEQHEVKKVKNLDEKELEEILKDSDAYMEYLGLENVEQNKPYVNTKEFPMDK